MVSAVAESTRERLLHVRFATIIFARSMRVFVTGSVTVSQGGELFSDLLISAIWRLGGFES